MSNFKTAMTDSTLSDTSQWSLLPNITKSNVATEDHLQSLGLDINDGLPKFNLNEPGPAALASSIFQQKNLNIDDDDSDKSFVVLGKTSFEFIREASMASYMEIQEKSTLTDHNSIISMMSPTEIEENLKKVLNENIKLKETLKQNNTAIKMQFNTITQWQKDVMTVCDNHKQKFQETKELISRLKKENDKLREKIAKNHTQELPRSTGQDTLTHSYSSFPSSHSTPNEKEIHEIISNNLHKMTFPSEPSKLSDIPIASLEYKTTDSELKKSSETLTPFPEFKIITDSKPIDSKPTDSKPTDSKPTDSKPIDSKPTDSKPTDSKPTDCKPTDSKPTDCKPTDSKPTDSKPTDCKPVGSNNFEDETAGLAGFRNLLKEREKLHAEQNQLQNEQDLLKKVDELSGELSRVRISNSTTQEVLKELEKRYHTDIEMFSQQLQKANKELDSFKQKSNSTNSLELQKLVNNCCEKDMRLKYLEEIIRSLELQIKKFEENGFPLVDLQIESCQESSDDMQQLKKNIEFYNDKLSYINRCFASLCTRYLRIQECLRESACIIQVFENARILPNDMITEEKVKNYKEKLCEFRKSLINEQLHSIDDRQAAIKTQQHFQKILSDYNSVICELEILKDENSKLQTLQIKAEEENSQKWAEIEKQLKEEKRILEKEKTELLEASLKVQIDKKSIVEEKRQIETERNSLSLEKEKLQDEKTNLWAERTSLDRQSKLYEAEEGTLQKEKKVLQKKCEYLCCEIDKLKHELQEAKIAINRLQANNNKLKENEELITVYKIQTEVREKEFEDMRTMHKTLQDQLQTLAFANLQLRSENDRLGGQESQASTSRYCGLCGASYSGSPDGRHGMGICTPEFD